MSVTVPLVTIEPPGRANVMSDKSVPDAQLTNFTQVNESISQMVLLRPK